MPLHQANFGINNLRNLKDGTTVKKKSWMTDIQVLQSAKPVSLGFDSVEGVVAGGSCDSDVDFL